jgi:hypothetical protein
MAKFLITGSLSLEVQPNPNGTPQNVTIPPDLCIKFVITRKALASTQTANFRIYGLKDPLREQIFKDRFDWTQFRAIQFQAGYPGFTPQIFNGTILQAYTEKEGNTDDVVVIDAFDGGYPMTNGWISTTVSPGTTAAEVISAFGGQLPGVVGPPIVGSFPTKNMRTEVLVGNTWGIIQEKSLGNATIDNGQVKALNLNEALSTPKIPLISAQTGLLGAPRRSGVMVEFDTVFEPRMNLFQLVDLQSIYNPQFNGPHKIMGFEHRGAIFAPSAIPNVTSSSFIFFSNPVPSPDLPGILLTS